MESSESKQSFFERLKDATNVVATRAREGIEDLQTRQGLSRAYNDLGRTTGELGEKGGGTPPGAHCGSREDQGAEGRARGERGRGGRVERAGRVERVRPAERTDAPR